MGQKKVIVRSNNTEENTQDIEISHNFLNHIKNSTLNQVDRSPDVHEVIQYNSDEVPIKIIFPSQIVTELGIISGSTQSKNPANEPPLFTPRFKYISENFCIFYRMVMAVWCTVTNLTLALRFSLKISQLKNLNAISG